jgi:hypothetical protein
MIAATVADDKRFNELPIDAALVYLMAIPQLDRDGLILGEPGALWGQVCRRRNDLLSRMDAIVAAWLAAGLVTAYRNEDGDTILHFVGFQKNQAMTHYDREGASRFPCPPGYSRTPKGLVQEVVHPTPQQPAEIIRTDSGPTPDEVHPNAKQSNVNECNVITNAAPDGVPAAPVPLAEQFHSLLAELKTTENKSAKLREIYVLCFGKDDAPDFGYLGKTAKDVGGAGRLAELFWQYSAKPPTGDVLAYIKKAHTQKGDDSRKERTNGDNRKPDTGRNSGHYSAAEAEYQLPDQYR